MYSCGVEPPISFSIVRFPIFGSGDFATKHENTVISYPLVPSLLSPISCSFRQKIGQIIGWRPSLCGWHPIWEILDPPLVWYITGPKGIFDLCAQFKDYLHAFCPHIFYDPFLHTHAKTVFRKKL